MKPQPQDTEPNILTSRRSEYVFTVLGLGFKVYHAPPPPKLGFGLETAKSDISRALRLQRGGERVRNRRIAVLVWHTLFLES